MAKFVIKQVVEAVTESVLRQLMPELDERNEGLRADIRALDANVDNLREEMLDRFERQLNTINEVSHRVTRVEGKLEGYMEGLRTVIGPLKVLPKRKAS